MLIINSIRTRVISIIIGTCLFILTVFFLYSYTMLSEYRELKLQEITKGIKSEVEYVNKGIYGIESTVKNIATTASQIYIDRHSLPKDSVRQYLLNILANSQSMASMSGSFGLWFEPYSFKPESKNFAVLVYKDSINNQIVTKWFEENESNYHFSSWYNQLLPKHTPKNDIYSKKKVFWSMPVNFTFGKEERFITNIGAYIYDENDHIVGIATIGWQMSDFIRMLEHINISANSKILLADIKYNQIITATFNPSLKVGSSLNQIPWFSQISSELPTLGQVRINELTIDGKPSYVFTVITDNNMLLASIVPESDLFEAIMKNFSTTILLLSIFALFVTIFTIYLVNKMLTRPIEEISGTIERLNREFDYEFDFKKAKASDEISALTSSFSKAIRHNYKTLRSILDGIVYMIYIIDTRTFKINYVNKHMQKYYPQIAKDAICYEAFLNRTEPCPFCPVVKLKEQSQETVCSEQSGVFFKKQVFQFQAAIVEWNASQNHALLSVTDITKEVNEKERLAVLAETDELTGALNRRGGLIAFEKTLALQKGVEISIAIIDLNGLKKVNDTFGHNEGDHYLRAAAQSIQQNVRTNDLVCRLGGDEFLVILPNCNELITERIFQKVNIDLSAILETQEKPYEGSFASGIVTFIADGDTSISEILEHADQNMYQNKNAYYNSKNK